MLSGVGISFDMNFRNLPFCVCISVRTRVNGRADKSQALPHKSVCRRMQLTINCWPAVTFYLFGTVHTELLKFSTGCLQQACKVKNYRNERKKKIRSKALWSPYRVRNTLVWTAKYFRSFAQLTHIFSKKRKRSVFLCMCEGVGGGQGWGEGVVLYSSWGISGLK